MNSNSGSGGNGKEELPAASGQASSQQHSRTASLEAGRDKSKGWATNKDVASKIRSSSDEISLVESSGPPPTLRRSHAQVFGGADASMDGFELRQPPHPRLVKIQPQDGLRRPGAYAHESSSNSGGSVNNNVADSVLPSFSNVLEMMPNANSLDGNKHPYYKWCFYLLVGLTVLGVITFGLGLGVTPFRSKSAEGDETPNHTMKCAMAEFEQKCSNDSTAAVAIPECMLKPLEDMKVQLHSSNFGMHVTDDYNGCSADSLALLSVALHASNEDSPTTLSNRLGLSLLFYTTNGRDWEKGRDWVSSEPHHYCDWYGVSCSKTGNVVTLDLEFFNMRETSLHVL